MKRDGDNLLEVCGQFGRRTLVPPELRWVEERCLRFDTKKLWGNLSVSRRLGKAHLSNFDKKTTPTTPAQREGEEGG